MHDTAPTHVWPIPVTDQAMHIAAVLHEPVVWLVQRVLDVMGQPRTNVLFEQALTVESEGGMSTVAEDRKRTPGGVFFQLVKETATSDERRAIFSAPPGYVKDRPSTPEKPSPAPIVPMSWDEAKVILAKVLKTPTGRASVKITLVGRPSQVSRTKSCVVAAMKGSQPPSLPKGLPRPPENSDFTYAVFIALKQWAKVAPSLAQNREDKLIVDGYPIFDPKRGVTVILAQSVRTVSSTRTPQRRRPV